MIDPLHYRRVLGHFPTGVAVITAIGPDGAPVGMAVGSFTSVSLDPPLVGFLPDKSSSSWPKIEAAGSFCVNILGHEQENVCRAFAMKGGDKFADLVWKPGPSGSPVLDGVLAWIDCDIEAVHEAGDHWIVVGRVLELDVASTSLPLVFFQGGYGRFRSLSLAAWEGDLASQVRSADLARSAMEAIAADLEVECVASAVVGEDMVLLASAGTAMADNLPTRIGQRIPFVPPLGTAFAAWAPEAARRAWVARLGKGAAPETVAAVEGTLDAVRSAGYSVGRGHWWHNRALATLVHSDPTEPEESRHRLAELIGVLPPDYESPLAAAQDPEVRTLSAPVFGSDGSVVLVLTITASGEESLSSNLSRYLDRLLAAASAVTAAMHGEVPR